MSDYSCQATNLYAWIKKLRCLTSVCFKQPNQWFRVFFLNFYDYWDGREILCFQELESLLLRAQKHEIWFDFKITVSLPTPTDLRVRGLSGWALTSN